MGSAGDLVATAGRATPRVAGAGLHPELAGGAGVWFSAPIICPNILAPTRAACGSLLVRRLAAPASWISALVIGTDFLLSLHSARL